MAHTIKGGSAIIGLTTLSELSYRIETILDHSVKHQLPNDFKTNYRQRSYQAFREKLSPVEGIYSLLDQITIPYCVASSGPVEKIRMNLTTTKLLERFEGKIFSCYDINKWKPEPDIFLYAAQMMGFAIEECVVIEDSVPGVQAAKTGGFDVFGYATRNQKERLENAGAVSFSRMSDLIHLLALND